MAATTVEPAPSAMEPTGKAATVKPAAAESAGMQSAAETTPAEPTSAKATAVSAGEGPGPKARRRVHPGAEAPVAAERARSR